MPLLDRHMMNSGGVGLEGIPLGKAYCRRTHGLYVYDEDVPVEMSTSAPTPSRELSMQDKFTYVACS
jgi:hypothetical protein